MTEYNLKKFKKLLEGKRDSIMRDLGLLEERSLHSTSADSSGDLIYSDHMPDLGSSTIEREKAFLFASRDGAYLSLLEQALQRIQDKTFGVCRVCRKDIPKKRMKAVPTTTICFSCKETNAEGKYV